MQTSTNGLNNKKIFGSSHGNNRKYVNHYEQMQKYQIHIILNMLRLSSDVMQLEIKRKIITN